MQPTLAAPDARPAPSAAPVRGLADGFFRSAQRHAGRPALVTAEGTLTYRELARRALGLAARIRRVPVEESPLVAVLAGRAPAAYAGVLGALAAGRGYVPLAPSYPLARLRRMLAASGARVLVAGGGDRETMERLLAGVETPLTVLLPDAGSAGTLPGRFPRHRFVPAHRRVSRGLEDGGPDEPRAGDVAYLLFTSGSTGDPKGVPVTHANVRAYLDHACELYGVEPADRVSQSFDLTFDLSVHDLFVAWERGACVCVLPDHARLAPAHFIREQRLTIWFSVPSAAAFLRRLGMLRPGAFPRLRASLFCGEALPQASAEAWARAAPNAVLDNLYGPTEATIAITRYRWDPAESPGRCVHGLVPIGWPFPGSGARVLEGALRPAATGDEGELCLGGPQVTPGYWRDPARTAERFVRPPGLEGRWYRTGDRVVEGPDGCLSFLGRLDDQVKVRGFRVELQEVDGVVREATGCDEVATVAVPSPDGYARGLVAFVAAPPADAAPVLSACRSTLPDYMVPGGIRFVDRLPRNANGKVDRRRLVEILLDRGEG